MPFSEAKADAALNFFELGLKHTKGRFTGQPFLLIDWEYEIISDVFGTLGEDGNRQYQTVYVEVPKKNGKSELAAGVALYCLIADNEPGAEVYSAAAAKDQAALVFKVAASMVEASPILSKKLRVIRSTKTIVKRNDPDSFYRAISADGDIQDGINPHCVIADELHRWKVGKALDLWEVLERGTIARSQPLVFAITTAGIQDESPLCWRYHEYERQVREGIFTDRRFYGKVYGAEDGEDWQDPQVWAKANPSLETRGGFLKVESLEKMAIKAANDPQHLAEFKRFHLNIWGQVENRWMPPDVWASCSGETRPTIGREVYIGLDLSSSIDLTAMVFLFPDEADDSIDVVPHFWMPEDCVRRRELVDKVPYSEWIRKGYIRATEGNVIDVREVKTTLAWAKDEFDVKQVCFDPWHAQQLSIELGEEGFTCVPIRQGFQTLSEPMKKLMQMALAGKIRHPGNPVLSWNANCVAVKSDGNDNIKPSKPDRARSSKRIDGISALLNAMSRWGLETNPQFAWSSGPVVI